MDSQPFTIVRNCRGAKARIFVADEVTHSNRWTLIEHKQYLSFFRENMSFAENRRLRKSQMIFNKMSAFIKTRTPTQIKSHHQKMLGKYGCIEQALKQIQNTITKHEQKDISQFTSDSVSQPSKVEFEEGELKRSKLKPVQLSWQLNLFDVLTWPDHPSAESDCLFQESV